MTDLEVRGADGVPIAVRDHGGDGPPILLLHGLSQNLAAWSLMVPPLTARHRVVSLDLRDHGRSGSGPWHWPAVLEDVERVVEGTGLDRPALVGHSLGGMVAALLGAQGGSWSAAVNLDGHVDGRPGDWAGTDPEVGQWRATQLQEIGARMMARGPMDDQTLAAAREAAVQGAMAMGLPGPAAAELWDRSVIRDGDVHTQQPTTEKMAEVLRAIGELDLHDVYRRSQCPVLVVHATVRPSLPPLPGIPEWAEEHLATVSRGIDLALDRLAGEVEHVTVARIAATHGLVLEAADEVAELVSRFVTESAGVVR